MRIWDSCFEVLYYHRRCQIFHWLTYLLAFCLEWCSGGSHQAYTPRKHSMEYTCQCKQIGHRWRIHTYIVCVAANYSCTQRIREKQVRDLLEKIALVEDELAIELRATTMQQVKYHEQIKKKRGWARESRKSERAKEVWEWEIEGGKFVG